LDDEYLFGPDILVAPVMDEGATERTVYLPAGSWIDFWSDTLHIGPCTSDGFRSTRHLTVIHSARRHTTLGPEMLHVENDH
jgi:hypothetical protein